MSEARTYIDTEELACRIAEACMGVKRPVGATAQSAIAECRRCAPDAADGFQRAALAAAEYISECVNAVNPGQAEITRVTVERTDKIQ